jgi:hypothetical protein
MNCYGPCGILSTTKGVEMATTARWDQQVYRRIERVRYDEDRALVNVTFADQSSVEFDPTPLVPSELEEIDWWRVASNPIEMLVPHANGWFEIPWDVIRRHTDPDYAAHWEKMASRSTRSPVSRTA